ncbi:MAG: hypothetical protein M3N24_10635 [Actinomycetota bacterium]|nr:hypothetical protein [Actinomycetota bacterium]
MQDQLEYGFGTAIFVLDHTTDKLTPEEADRSFSEVTKENFRRMWPGVRDWAETLWHTLEEERGHMASAVEDEEGDEVGGGG